MTSSCKPIHLERGDWLRIHDGRGTRLTPASGVLWITEEGSAVDAVLLPGEAHRLENPGIALVLAHRPARVVLEVPSGESPPRLVDHVFPDGTSRRRIAFGHRTALSLGAWAAAIGATRIATLLGA
jgi:hypothetical protein